MAHLEVVAMVWRIAGSWLDTLTLAICVSTNKRESTFASMVRHLTEFEDS